MPDDGVATSRLGEVTAAPIPTAIHDQPAAFRNANLVVSVAPFLFNEGVKSAAVYPLDVAARLSVREQFAAFFPMRAGVLVRFISDAFLVLTGFYVALVFLIFVVDKPKTPAGAGESH